MGGRKAYYLTKKAPKDTILSKKVKKHPMLPGQWEERGGRGGKSPLLHSLRTPIISSTKNDGEEGS
jgi:hypothetical protein